MSRGDLLFPPGFRFHPTDEELVMHYLCKKCAGFPIAVPIVAEIDLYKFDPWLLPGMALYGDKEWYFFSPRDRKYPNGSRPNRAAGSGYWKATGADKPVGSPKPVAIKKSLVFYSGKAPKGDKTNWIMHEYRLAGVDRSARKKNSLRLDDWVLCRIYKKKSVGQRMPKQHVPLHAANGLPHVPKFDDSEMFCFDTSDTMPTLHAESSCSEHVLSPCDWEVESQLSWGESERVLGVPLNNADATAAFPSLDCGLQSDPLQDMLMYLQNPF